MDRQVVRLGGSWLDSLCPDARLLARSLLHPPLLPPSSFLIVPNLPIGVQISRERLETRQLPLSALCAPWGQVALRLVFHWSGEQQHPGTTNAKAGTMQTVLPSEDCASPPPNSCRGSQSMMTKGVISSAWTTAGRAFPLPSPIPGCRKSLWSPTPAFSLLALPCLP